MNQHMSMLPAALPAVRGRLGSGRASRLLGVGAAAAVAALFATLAGCAVPGKAIEPMAPEQEVVVEGRVLSVDLSPMAYDGDALVLLDSQSHGAVTVHVPARTNLCRAQGLEVLGELRPQDRIRVAGKATGQRDITVCESPTHRLQRLD